MRKRKISVMLAAVAMATASLGGLIMASAPAQAASCGSSQALCMFANANSGGAVLGGQKSVCGYYRNLADQGFNDVMSSIDNWANYTQSFWTDAGQRGRRLDVKPMAYLTNLSTYGCNDQISSVVWTG
ncbi:MAG: hypothetical protein LBV30_02130 [Propionibacteriaceae bacterium]|jgi:hypothetical protein|nr:hypothetical protein [Propionibacteriaceae bacterium]